MSSAYSFYRFIWDELKYLNASIPNAQRDMKY
jgi:hypothetical protein